MKSKNIFGLVILTFSLVLLIPNSFAFGYRFEGDHMVAEDGKVYPIIVVELPYDLYYQSNYKEIWNKIYKSVSSAKDFIKIKNETIFSNFKDLSIPSIAKHFGATIWRKTDGYTKIIVPNESYEEIVKTLEGLGLKVRKNFALKLHLSESRGLIGLPYFYLGSELTGQNSRIAILDTGVDTNHPDLPWGTKVIFWNDTFFPPGNPNHLTNPADPEGHGTHVSSIAAGTGTNSSGLYKGVAPGAPLLVWRVCAPGCDPGAAAEAIDQAIRENTDVISMSFGINPQIWDMLFSQGQLPCSFAAACAGTCPPGTDTQDFVDAIMRAINNNIPVVAAAGNEGSYPNTVGFPACIPNVIAVGATHKKDYSLYEEKLNWLYTLFAEEGYPIPREENVSLHVIISVTTDNPPQVFEDEFNTTWEFNVEDSQFYVWKPAGFQKVFQPQNWPATIRVRIEGEHRHRDCYQAERTWWDPGWKDKGDEYWTREQTFDYDPSKPYIVVEISALANGARGGAYSCLFDTVDWYKAYYNHICSGTALSCDSFDYNRNGCGEQGCSWCGCACKDNPDTPRYYCHPDLSPENCPSGCLRPSLGGYWEGCQGTPKPCGDRNPDNGEICGSPSTTGCISNPQWIDVKIYRTDALSLKSLPTFFSSRGPSVFGIKPDVTAPGHEICAARASGTCTDCEEYLICGNDNYIAYSGTSMAAPMVAGEIALMKEGSGIAGVNPSIGDIRQGVMEANEKVFSGNPDNEEGYGLINVQKAIDYITDCNLKFLQAGYSDTSQPQCSNYDYTLYSSANQMRDYYWSDSIGNCDCNVIYDSYIPLISVSGVTSGDANVLTTSYIYVDVDVKNTGNYQQGWWYLGVEFWNVSDYNNPWGTRDSRGRINAYYNGKDGTHGCLPGNCPAGVDCTIINESVSANGKLDVGEIIRVRCQAPASFYKPTTGNERIMFWIHERDLGQDATNDGDTDGDGYISEWWTDALARVEPASVRVKIVCRTDAYDSDGGKVYKVQGTCTDYYQQGSECKYSRFTDTCICYPTCIFGTEGCDLRNLTTCAARGSKTECEADSLCYWALLEYYTSSDSCAQEVYNCSKLGSNYYCYSGRCYSSSGGGGGGGCPTLFVWNGEEFEKDETLNIHASSDVTLQRKIEKNLKKGLLYSLQLRELDNFTSHIDQVKLYTVDSKGNKHEFPLIYAYHNKLGFVWFELSFNDERRIDLKPNEIIDLKFLAISNNINYFVFEIKGYNMKALI